MKMMNKNRNASLERLEGVLDIYGAQPLRWPEEERTGLERLIGREPAARRLRDESAALGRVMDLSRGMTASGALKARILEAAVNDREHEARVVPINTGQSRAGQPGFARAASYWQAAALAASFAVGLYLGVAGLGDQAYDDAIQVSGLAASDVGDGDATTWLDVTSGSGSEGLL